MKTRRVESKLKKEMKTRYSFLHGINGGPTTAREALTDLRKGIKEHTPTGKDKYINLSGEKNGFFDLQNSPVSVIYDLLNFLISKKESTHWYSFLQSVIEGKEAKSKDSFFLEDKDMIKKSKPSYARYRADPPAFTTGGLLNAIEEASDQVFDGVERDIEEQDTEEAPDPRDEELAQRLNGPPAFITINPDEFIVEVNTEEEEVERMIELSEERDARRRDDDEERARLENPF